MELLDYAKLSQEVLCEINLARHIPNTMITELVRRYEYFDANIYRCPGHYPIETYEGDIALTDAIDFLKEQTPLPTLTENKKLQKIALEYAEDLIHYGNFTKPHIDSLNKTPTERISKVLKWSKMVGECIAIGEKTAIDIVLSLIIDDGNEERSNRKVILNKDAKMVGVVCVPHSVFGVLTVIDIIGAPYENDGRLQYHKNIKE